MRIVSIAFVFFSFSTLHAQFQENARILSSGFASVTISTSKHEVYSSSMPSSGGKSSGFTLNPELLIGTYKNHKMFSYGLSFRYGNTWQSQTNADEGKHSFYAISPTAAFQRFHKITERLYYSPSTRLSIGYEYSTQRATPTSSSLISKGVIGAFEFSPLAITFAKSDKLFFNFRLSKVALDYNRTRSYNEPYIPGNYTVSSNLLLSGGLSYIGFGIQKVL